MKEIEARSVQGLQRIVAPLSSEEFIGNYWCKSFVHIPGERGKFSQLMPWARLDEILSYHQFPSENLVLIKGSEQVPVEKYMERNNPKRLNAAQLTNLLADGATLLLRNLDDISSAIRNVTIALERTLRARVWVNLYAGWGTDCGFDLHWDDHPTMIVQVHGRKHWKVFRPTRTDPFRSDAEPASPPAEAPIWDGVLEEGGFFHIPRGRWHVANPVGAPCMHLTIGCSEITGVDLVHWIGERLKSSDRARQNVPYLEPSRIPAHLEALWRDLQAAWTPDLVESYLATVETEFPPRPELQLPEAATPNGLVLDENSVVKLASPFPLNLPEAPQNGTLSFKTFKKVWQCPEFVVPALHALNDGEPHRVGDLCALSAGASNSPAICGFLSALMFDGVVTKVDASGEAES